MSTNNSSQQYQHISHLITTSFNKSHELFLRNHLTKFKAIDFISHIYHNLITTLSQLHFNKLFNNYSDRSSTNSSTIIVTDLQQTLLITNFHNIIQELEDYSSHTFTTYFIDNKLSTNSFHKHQYSFMWQIIHHILSQHYHKLFIEYFNKFQHIFIMRQQIRQQIRQQTLQQVSTRWMSIDFLLQLIQQTMIQFFINIHSHSF